MRGRGREGEAGVMMRGGRGEGRREGKAGGMMMSGGRAGKAVVTMREGREGKAGVMM